MFTDAGDFSAMVQPDRVCWRQDAGANAAPDIAIPKQRGRIFLKTWTAWKRALALAAALGLLLLAAGCSTEATVGRESQEVEPSEQGDSGGEESAGDIARIEVENYGTITVELDAEAAPETVANFVALAREGFYDGLTFHRIIQGFMIQGGDPKGDGTGGSETTIKGEFSENGVENPLSHTRGAISMARSDASYDSASSQFFSVQEDSTYMDGSYAAFGYVTEGMDVVDAICAAAEPIDNNGLIAQEDQPVITSITILEDGAGT